MISSYSQIGLNFFEMPTLYNVMKRYLKILTFLVFGNLAVAAPLPVETAIDALEPGWRVPMALSSDGQQVAYCVVQPSRKQPMLEVDPYRSQTGVFAETVGTDIWIADARNGSFQNLTGGQGSNFAPVWSPDGRRLAFVSDRDGASRLWLWENGELRRVGPELVWLGVGFECPTWTPDGMAVMVKLLPPDMTLPEAAALENPAAAEKHKTNSELILQPPKVFRHLPGHQAEKTPTTTQRGAADLARVEVATGQVQRIASRVVCSGWWVSPDGRYLAYSSLTGRMSETDQRGAFALHLCELKTGRSRTLVARFASDFGKGVSWSPDSRHLAYTTMGHAMDYSQCEVSITDLQGEGRLLAQGPYYRYTKGPDWLDSETLLLSGSEGLALLPLDGKLKPLADLKIRQVVGTGDNGRCYRSGDEILAVTGEGLARVNLYTGKVERDPSPPIQEAVRRPGGPLFSLVSEVRTGHELQISSKRVHHFNPGFSETTMGRSRVIEYVGPDGAPLKAAVLLPPDYREGERRPGIFVVYGGTMGSRRANTFGLLGPGCENMQILASRGYVVICPDIPIDRDPVKNIRSAVQAAFDATDKEGLIDPERVAIMGHSYGGYTTLAAITGSQRFKAAISNSGISNLLHEYLRFDDGESSFLAYTETGQGKMNCTPWENLERFIENSPVFALDKVTTPLMLIHGDQDNDAWVDESGQVFVGLRRLDKSVTYVSYPGEGHWQGTWTRANVLDYWERILTFLSDQGV